MTRVLIVVKSGVFDDARIRRAARALADAGFEVEVIGDRPTSGAPIDGVSTRFARAARAAESGSRSAVRSQRIVRWFLLPTHRRRDDRQFAAAVLNMAVGPADIVHCNDFNTLELGQELADCLGARLIYDAHECWTGRQQAGHPTPLRRYRERRLEREFGRQAAARITVSPGLAKWFRDTYGWDDTVVVHNSFPGVPGACELSRPTGVVYAGRVDASRDLRTAVAAFAGRDELALDIVGPRDERFAAELERSGVVVHEAIGVDDLIERYRSAGLALVPLMGKQINHRVALPNKLFQAVQAGVPVIAADLPEIRRYVTEFDIGVLFQPGSVASLREATDEAVARYQELCAHVRSAAPQLAWSRDEQRLLSVYSSLGMIEPRREDGDE
jgi:glycosyltransferase involved in cell wall biosynthesis